MKGILHPSVDYFYLLLCKVKSPAFYAVAALYLTVSFLAKKFTLERGKYLLSTWGNPLEYEKKLYTDPLYRKLAIISTYRFSKLMSIYFLEKLADSWNLLKDQAFSY